MTTFALRRLLAIGLLALGFACSIALLGGLAPASADAKALDLETLSGAEEEQMFQRGQVSAVELVEAYLARIAALNKAGPAINAVTQINPDVYAEAEKADRERREGKRSRTRYGPADPAQGHHRRHADVHHRGRLGTA